MTKLLFVRSLARWLFIYFQFTINRAPPNMYYPFGLCQTSLVTTGECQEPIPKFFQARLRRNKKNSSARMWFPIEFWTPPPNCHLSGVTIGWNKKEGAMLVRVEGRNQKKISPSTNTYALLIPRKTFIANKI